jgi:hypothetical protein
MAEACYMARATTEQQVLDRTNKLTLQTTAHGQYHDAILSLQLRWCKKYKGYRFKPICNEIKAALKPRITFTADLGEYTPEEGENKNDKWITVTSNGKTKNLLKPKL